MSDSILYLGDTSLETAAAYLAGVMTHAGLKFDHVAGDAPLAADAVAQPRPLYILSDFPARLVPRPLQQRIAEHVARGAGLLMLGGWESYCGLGGDWADTPLGEILPVHIARSDDRRNCDDLVLVACANEEHPAVRGLPWRERPPIIGGFNEVRTRAGAELLLTARRYRPRFAGTDVQLTAGAEHPLLVVGVHGHGRTAALTTDVAPHWVGPLVDWGDERVSAQAPGAPQVEVGSLYVQFLRQLLEWTMQR